ncbi:unnamed protein product [Gadus morhua 'NCC']
MNAFLKGVLGKKSSQEIPTIPIAVNEQTTHDEEEDDEDNTSGFKKDNLRRNSRFYRSMRKKRLPSSESSQTSGSIKAVYEPDAVSRVKSLNVQPRKTSGTYYKEDPVQEMEERREEDHREMCLCPQTTAEEIALIQGMVINERQPQAPVASGHSLNIVKNMQYTHRGHMQEL